MIYSQLGNDTQGLEYKDDPLARTIAPNYEKLSMSAWGIPQLDDMDKFAPKMLESLDTTPNEYTQYITNFNDLSQAAQKFMKMGVDITKPSLDPMQNAAHQEWLKKYNDNLALGYRLQQSRREKEKYNTMLGKAGVWTNPLDETKMVTSLDDLVYSPDFDTFEKGILAKAKKRELLFGSGQKELANAELQDIKRQLDTYPDSVPPAFKEHAKKRADYLKSLIPDAMDDLEAQDKSAQGWARIRETGSYHKALLGLARDKFGWQQSQSAPIEFDTESLIRKAGSGDIQAIDLINKYYGHNDKGEKTGAGLVVIKGSNVKNGIPVTVDGEEVTVKANKLKQPDGSVIEVKDDQNYFVRTDENGKRYITPVNDISIQSFTQGVIGKTLEAGTSKNKTSNLWSEYETEISDTPITAKKTSSQSSYGSNTQVTKSNTGTSNSQPKKKIRW